MLQDPDGNYRLDLFLNNDTISSVSDRNTPPSFDYHPSSSAPNITLILILSAIFIILLISALLTCSRKKTDSTVADYDGDTESVMNMRIMTTLARLSRVHVVSVQHHLDQDSVLPPPLPQRLFSRHKGCHSPWTTG